MRAQAQLPRLAGMDRPLRVVVAGGGVAGLEALIALRELAEERVELELISPEPYFWYRPLASAEPFGPVKREHFDLATLADDLGAGFTIDAVTSVDAEAHVARTARGSAVEYDVLVLAHGTLPEPAVEGAPMFRGPADVEAFTRILRDLESGEARRLVIAVPSAATWPLPAYELALQTAAAGHGEVVLVTAEEAPLILFGRQASGEVARHLREAGVEVRAASHPLRATGSALEVAGGPPVAYDRLIALPRLRAVPIGGVPRVPAGFVPVDGYGRVEGLEDVYAAGDATTTPVKQGGVATQLAAVVARSIARRAGAEIEVEPFRPVLRAILLTGGAPLFLRSEPTAAGETSTFDEEALWWPPSKIAGRYLGPFLAAALKRSP
jgi:sulfide:quinone oxidoreductase